MKMIGTLTQKAIYFSLFCGLTLAMINAQANTRNLFHSSGAIVVSQPSNPSCKSPLIGQKFARTELYFGSLKPNQLEVTEAEFTRFLSQEISPRFPDGLTLLKGFGEFRGSNGKTIQETSRLVIVFYPFATESSQKIEDIRRTYKTQFKQESVLRVDDESCISF
jgi:Protein of unknown function (DUF3574)